MSQKKEGMMKIMPSSFFLSIIHFIGSKKEAI